MLVLYTQKRVKHIFFFSETKVYKRSLYCRLTILKILGHIFGRVVYLHLKLLKFKGFRFLATKDSKCHS